jgi:hypothetical protein
MEDVQDPTIIEWAVPHEGSSSARELTEAQAVLAADESGDALKLHIERPWALAAVS